MKNLVNSFFSLLMSVCVVLIQNYFKLIFQTFVSLFVLFFFYKVGNGEINGCGARKNILKSGGGGAKNFFNQG